MSKVYIALIAMNLGIFSFSCSDSTTNRTSSKSDDSQYTLSPSSPKTQQCPYTMAYVKNLGDSWISNLELIARTGRIPSDEFISKIDKQEFEIKKIQREIHENVACIEQYTFLSGVRSQFNSMVYRSLPDLNQVYKK